jgi:hypothetical protein
LTERATAVLANVEFRLGEDYRFDIREGHGGVFLQAVYCDADIYTGHREIQYTRKWLLSPSMTDSEIVQTAFKCAITSAEHRAREAFKYRGARIFGPHFDCEDLVSLCTASEAAGGRKPPETH